MLRHLFTLALRSVLNRRLTAGLTILSVAVSVTLLLGVDRIRTEARAGFENTITGADLIVGARGGQLNLLLYSVFRIGDATSGISWASYQDIAARPEVAWTIPLSLGDSHRGYRVVGTTDAYFEHYRYGRDQSLETALGQTFDGPYDAVLGAEVARALGYAIGDAIVVSHGIGEVSFEHHDDRPFTVAGILAPTGTPVDRSVHVTLAGMEAIHGDHPPASPGDDHSEHGEGHEDHAEHHTSEHGEEHEDHAAHDASEHGEAHEDHAGHDADEHGEGHEGHAGHQREQHAEAGRDGHGAHEEHAAHEESDGHATHEGHHGHAEHAGDPESITAFIVGLESRPLLLRLQRHVNEYEPEPLTAIVPGVALQQLWGMLGVAEAALLGISILVVAAGLVGMLTTLLTGLAQRRREMAVLRAVGAGPGWIFSMLIVEALLLAAAASIVGLVTVHGAMPLARRALLDQFGLALAATPPGAFDLVVAAAVTLAGGAVATFPAWRIYRYSLADGLTVRT
ncbi:MAG: FtsX-like permease family protein [Gammaproteobacteria bacterium]|nr:FtsX-like permease family protein [Gammaproteobacteria bacterium]